MLKKLKIGVIFGGRSQEHEVSIVSASSIIKALDKKKYEVIPIGITKQGGWIVGDPLKSLRSKKMTKYSQPVIFPADPTFKHGLYTFKNKLKILKRLDCVFPVLHGPYGEDGTLQGVLEMAGIPYVGSSVLASACGTDKTIAKALFRQDKLPVVLDLVFRKIDWSKNKKQIQQKIEKKIRYPCFIKPADLGSSVGVTKAHTRKELISGIKLALKYTNKILIEKAVKNAREIECSVLGNEKPKASLPGEIISSNEFYDYDAKYVDGKSKIIVPVKLPKKLEKKIRDLACQAFLAINGEGMARVDFLVEKKTNKIYLNEINTIPGFTSISMYPKLWEASGIRYSKLLDRLIKLALERHKEKSQLKTSFEELKSKWYTK